jgi:hypothetical protein
MRSRPWPIVIIACVCILAPLFNIAYSAGLVQKNIVVYFSDLLTQRPLWEIGLWFFLPILAGICLLAFNNWSYLLFLAFMFLVLYFTHDQWRMYPEKFTKAMMALSQLINLSVIGYFLHPSVRMIYFKRNLRWWQQKPRYLCDLQGSLKNGTIQSACQVKNVSEGGVLITTEFPIPENGIVTIKFNLLDDQIQATGRAVLRGRDGYGIMFQEIHTDLKIFRNTLKSLPHKGFKPRIETQPWHSSLKEWILMFLKTGKGLIPKIDRKQ